MPFPGAGSNTFREAAGSARLPRMTTRRWMIVIAASALDFEVIVHGPDSLAAIALLLTVITPVLGTFVLLFRMGNEGPGKTLY